MTLDELTALLHRADRGGIAVTFTTINRPDSSRGKMYGMVTWGMLENSRVFHDEEELRGILKQIEAAA